MLEAGYAGDEGATLSAISGTEYWIQIVQGRYSPRARCELNIHPFAGETPYFDELSRRYFRLLGAERNPFADPDGDGYANLVEATFNGNLETPDYNNDSLPHLVFHAGEWKLEWYLDTFFQNSGSLPLIIHSETSLNMGSDWVAESPTILLRSRNCDF